MLVRSTRCNSVRLRCLILCRNREPGLLSVEPGVHGVAAEQLIRSVAGQHDLDAAAVDLLEESQGHDGVDDVAVLGRFADPDRLADVGEPDVAGTQRHDLVPHTEIGGQAAGVGEVLAVLGADRERHAVGMHLVHVQQRQRTVQSSGQHHADGEIGVDTHPDRLAVGAPDESAGLLLILDHRLILAQPQQIHVRMHLRRRPRLGPAAVARGELVDGLARVDEGPDEGLDLRRDGQPTVGQGPVERFDAGRIPGQEHATGLPVDQREGELAPEPQQRILAPREDRLQHHLRVAGGAHAVALRDQLRAQYGEVEDLAVVGERPPAVRRQPRLDRAVPVDDAEAVGADQHVVVGQGLLDLTPRGRGRHHGDEARGVGSGV